MSREALEQTLAAIEEACERVSAMTLEEVSAAVEDAPFIFSDSSDGQDYFIDALRAMRYLRDTLRARRDAWREDLG